MKFCMRWFGSEDPVSLEKIRQVPGVAGAVTALHEPAGAVWPLKKVMELKDQVESKGLELQVIESIPVHEDIKLGRPTRNRYIENYCESVENLGRAGIGTLCYNFMPVFDWTRTDLARPAPDGSTSLSFDYEAARQLDLTKKDSAASLPGWGAVYTKEELVELVEAFSRLSASTLWGNLAYFLEKVVPVAEAAGVRLAIHPDDPPFPIFGIPRIIVDGKAMERVARLVDSPANGLTFCTGSLGAVLPGALPRLAAKLAERIHFVHLRNVYVMGNRSFHEAPHPSRFGSVDMFGVMKSLVSKGYDGPVRPDHGRSIWEEEGRPGYGLFDRALGVTYLQGLHEGVERSLG